LLPPLLPPLCFFWLFPPFPAVLGGDCTGAGWDTGGDCTGAEEWLDEVPEDPLDELWLLEACACGAGADASVIAGAVCGLVWCAGLGLGFALGLGLAAGFFGAVAVVDVVVATGAAARVEVVCETLPQPAAPTAASVMATSARFINPTPVFA
jgi:hypothetical protein